MAEFKTNEVLLKIPHVKTLTSGAINGAKTPHIFTAKEISVGGNSAGEGEIFNVVSGSIFFPFKVYSFKIIWDEYTVRNETVEKISDYVYTYQYMIEERSAKTPYGVIVIEYENWLSDFNSFSGVLLTSQWEWSINGEKTKDTLTTPCWIDDSTNTLEFTFHDMSYKWSINNGIVSFNWSNYFNKYLSKEDNSITDSKYKYKLTKLSFVAIGD